MVEKNGINVSISRSIHFGKTPKDLINRQKAVNFIEASYLHYSKPGTYLKDLLEVGKKAYSEVGFSHEWKNHSQGGIVGYKPREILVTGKSKERLKENNILSWNPTVRGAKAEDLVLVRKERIEQLYIDRRWPCSKIKIDGDIYLKPKILEL